MRIPGVMTVNLWEAHGTHERPMGVPCEDIGTRRPIVVPWEIRAGGAGKSMGKHCASRGRPVEAMQTHGSPMGFRWAITLVQNPWETYWVPAGVSWETKGDYKPM